MIDLASRCARSIIPTLCNLLENGKKSAAAPMYQSHVVYGVFVGVRKGDG